MSAKGLRSWQVGARASVLAVVVASATMRVVAASNLHPRISVGTPMGVEGVARITVEAEMFMHQDCGARRTALLLLVD